MRSATGPRIVKKYGNRRLYDTAESRYVTLEELAASVRAGAEVRVVDAQTGDDLTQTVLLQMVFEGRGAAQFLSVPILTQLVRMSDDALADFLGRWLSAAMELYQSARSGITSVVPYNPLAVPYAAGNLLARVLSAVPGPWMPPQVAPSAPFPGTFPEAHAAPAESPPPRPPRRPPRRPREAPASTPRWSPCGASSRP
jgi:polyhydroxyalkanoate synthesis repressor PhaR